MRSFLRHSTKYDGSLHYRYKTQLVHEEPGQLMIYCPPGTVCESYRGQLLAAMHSLEIYWPDRWYNLSVAWHADWRPRWHYVNIATPATWDAGQVSFVDLDLDVIWRAATDEVILDDEDEFARHQARFSYPPDLIAQALRASDEVRRLMAGRFAPFDGEHYSWRPHATA